MKKKETKYVGILQDKRPKALKEKDYSSKEISLGTVEIKVVSEKTAEKNAKAYISRNQKSKSSCVPSSIANALWNTEKVVLADEPWYTKRFNKPSEGCYWFDICEMALRDAYLRSECPEVYTEAEANAYKIPKNASTKVHRQKSYVFFENPSIEEIAKYLSIGVAFPFSIYATTKEWSKKTPEILEPNLDPLKATVHHAICAIPNTVYRKNGKLHFWLTDSAHFGGYDKRIITPEFGEKRIKHGAVFTDLTTSEPTDLPDELVGYSFTRNLKVGMRGDDVRKLQVFLRSKGFLATEIEGIPYEPTEYFGGMTRQAVKDYQEAYSEQILKPLGLSEGTGVLATSTRKFINKEING